MKRGDGKRESRTREEKTGEGGGASKLKSTNRFALVAPGANLLSRASRGPLIGTRSGFSSHQAPRDYAGLMLDGALDLA